MTRLPRGERGATVVEFGLVAPVALLLIGFVLTFGFYGVFTAIAQNAVRKATRYASIPVDPHGESYPSDGAVFSELVDSAPGVMGVPSSFEVARVGGGSPGNGAIVTVTVTYGTPVLDVFDGLLQGIGLGGLTEINRTASARME